MTWLLQAFDFSTPQWTTYGLISVTNRIVGVTVRGASSLSICYCIENTNHDLGICHYLYLLKLTVDLGKENVSAQSGDGHLQFDILAAKIFPISASQGR